MTDTFVELERRVGHPDEKRKALNQRVQNENVKRFADVQFEWLDVMWTLDAYRAGGVAPRGMGKPSSSESKRLEAAYKGKGNWFATLLALLLENQTSHVLAPRARVQGFSQTHQIDVAWPDRKVDPLVCLETKVTGAPASPTDPARGAMADWSNRRKELKFAATDLKLFRRQHMTAINHWDVWRAQAPPKVYFLWGARLTPTDQVSKVLLEVKAVVNTYLEGAGVVAWHDVGDRYDPVPIPPADRVSTVDDVLYRIGTEIANIAPPGGHPPPPQTPSSPTIDVAALSK